MKKITKKLLASVLTFIIFFAELTKTGHLSECPVHIGVTSEEGSRGHLDPFNYGMASRSSSVSSFAGGSSESRVTPIAISEVLAT